MNTDKLKLRELTTVELKVVEGGNPIAAGVGIAAGIWGCYSAIRMGAYHVGYFIGKNF